LTGTLRRGLTTAALLATGAALAGAGLAGPAAAASAASPRSDPTITIRVGGIRTAENGPPGPPTATGLAGVTFRVTPASAGFADTCVSTAAGLCALQVTANRTYTITQVGTPGGWFANPKLDAGSGQQVTARTYDALSVAVGSRNVTVPGAAPNSDTSATARGGTWALSRDDPTLPNGCGLRIALLMDLSGSITTALLPTYKAAARAFVESLEGTPSSIAIYTFGTTGPAPGANNATLPPVSVANASGVRTLVAKINGLTVPASSGTNWDAGLWQIVRDMPAYHYQSTIIVTDGDPTYYGPPGNLGGRGNLTRFAETENGVFSANALKDEGSSVLSVGIGTLHTGLRYIDNIRAISGPGENKDYFNTDFRTLSNVLAKLALHNCAGLDVTKRAAPATYTHAGQKITYSYTVTNRKYFTLHDVHVTDDRIARTIPCAPSTLRTGETATCTAGYTISQSDVDAGHVTNTAHANGATPNSDDVASPLADATVTAIQAPAIHLVKSAFPTDYADPGETITYTYTVANTGNVTLHGITLHDDRLGTITCPETTLSPGDSATCYATHITTRADVDAGHITNTAAATAHPPTGPPVTDTDRDSVHAIQTPAIQLDKSAFPTEYAKPGETIRYTYVVANTGNVTLHGITLHDDRLAAITCPETTLSPGDSATCYATHVTTTADVDAGHITNTAAATAHPPTGPPVTDTDRDTVHAIRKPAIQLDKTASPASYSGAGETITYSYAVTNAGNVTLHRITLHDDRLGTITCPATTLAAGASMICHATHTTTTADVDAGHIVNTATVTGRPPTGPAVSDADEDIINAHRAPRIKLVKSAFPSGYGAAGEIITYTYTVTNTGNVTLHGITVNDDQIPGPIVCLSTALSPGQSTTCQAPHIVTAADMAAGHITNAGTVTGQPPAGPAVTDGDNDTVDAIRTPGIQLVKTAFPTRYAAPGETVTYSYLVVNTGNVALHDITVTDNAITGPVGCPASTLDPGDSTTCHAVHTITSADVTSGHITNVGTVTGQPPTGPAVTGKSTETVEAIHRPGLQVGKSASPTRYRGAGEAVAFRYTVTNTGNVPLHDITVSDDKITGPVGCPGTVLDPGDSMTCHATYVTTATDVTVGYVTNVATVTGRPPTGPALTDRDEESVTLIALPVVPVTG
jgi:uncharacterized repeat protein (TIGR01451 family)